MNILRHIRPGTWYGIVTIIVLMLGASALLKVEVGLADRAAIDSYGSLLEAKARLRIAAERRTVAARTAALTDEIRSLSRGLILDYQIGEIVRILETRCDDEITPELVLRVIARESAWDPRARGRHGEIGLGQVKPGTAAPHLKALGLIDSLADPVVNVTVVIEELKRLRAECGTVGLALAAYNRGLGDPGVRYARAVLEEP